MQNYKKLLKPEQALEFNTTINNAHNYYLEKKRKIIAITNSEYGWDMEYTKEYFFDEYEIFFRKLKMIPERAEKSPASYKRLLRQINLWKGNLKSELDQKFNDLKNKYTYREKKDKLLTSSQRDDISKITEADERYFQWYLKQTKEPKTVYRGDGRSITAEFLRDYNFTPILPGGTPDITFYGVVEHTHTSSQKNGMVSTTTDRVQAQKWATDDHNYSIVYDMEVRNYINVGKLLKTRNFKDRFAEQLEILIPGKITAAEIKRVTLYHKESEIGALQNI